MISDNVLSVLNPPIKLTLVDKAHPILKEVCQPVQEIGPEIKSFARDMLYTLQANPVAVGLAAPQVGANLRIIVMSVPGKKAIVLINPVLLGVSKAVIRKQEGCLSFPNEFMFISRPKWASVRYTDLSGNRIRRKFHAMEAQCVLHELDHLEGKLFNE